MKNKIKVVPMTLKIALLGVIACAFVACGESKGTNKETNKKAWRDYSRLSKDEFKQLDDECNQKFKNACQKLIDNGLPSVSQCDDGASPCLFVGTIYQNAGQYKQAFEYFERGCGL